MAGQIVGALVGYSALPRQWIERVPQRKFVERVATPLALKDFRNIPRSRNVNSST